MLLFVLCLLQLIFFSNIEPFEHGAKLKFKPALIATIERTLQTTDHDPKPEFPYRADIVLGMDSASGFPQIQGQDTGIKTDHMTPGGFRNFRIAVCDGENENGTDVFVEQSQVSTSFLSASRSYFFSISKPL